VALLGAAVWADLQPIYWMLSSIQWLLGHFLFSSRRATATCDK